MQVVRNLGYPSMLSLFFNVLFTLFLLLGLNRLLARVAPAWALSRVDLLLIYTVLAVGTATAQFAEYVVPVAAGPFRLGGAAREDVAGVQPPLGAWLLVRDEAALDALKRGDVTLTGHLAAWARPFAGWTAFIALLLGTTFCLGSLYFRHWVDRERLPFPIARVPLELTAPSAGGGRPLFLLGFGLAGALILWNGLASFQPWVPMLPIKRQPLDLFVGLGMPWSVLGARAYSLHPFVIGLGYFLPLDLTFSVGAFHWLQQLVRVGAAAAGLAAEDPRFPYVQFQSFGAWIALFVAGIALSAGHLRRVLQAVRTSGAKGEGSSPGRRRARPPLPYAVAALGGVVGAILLTLFGVGFGLAPWAAIAFVGIYLALVLTMTRARLELGPPAVDLFLTAPGGVMAGSFGGRMLGESSLWGMGLLYPLWLEYPWHPMGHQLEALRIGEEVGVRHAVVALLVGVAALAGWAIGFAVVLHLDYSLGAATARQAGTQAYYARQAFETASGWVRAMAPPNVVATAATAGGALVAAGLSLARLRLPGWPLHPVGYALGSAFTTDYLWLPLWISCLLKGVVLRYGGLRLYRQLLPLFLGLVLGEFVVGGAWALLGTLLGVPTYVFWPY
jgi:hypothetical protein